MSVRGHNPAAVALAPRPPGRHAWRLFAATAGPAACLFALLSAVGCADQTVHVTRADELRKHILREDRPVLVCFYKFGCVTSMALDPGLLQLAEEYRDRVVVVRYLHLYPWFQVNSISLGFEHRILIVPTVILFVNGRERERWVADYYLPHYRRALDGVLAETPGPAGADAPLPADGGQAPGR